MVEDGERVELPIYAELRRKRKANQEQLHLWLSWQVDVAKELVTAGLPYPTRLWLVIKLQTTVENPRGGWVVPRKALLETMGLVRAQYLSLAIAKLEARGLIQARRTPGKRTEVRLISKSRSTRASS